MRFDAAKISRITTKSRFRSTCERRAVRKGPHIVTVKAKRLTSQPAWESVIPRSRASSGRSPMMRNSVVMRTKPDSARSRIGRLVPCD
jgi:hypothetical protein